MALDAPQKLQVKERPDAMKRMYGFMYALQRAQRTGPSSPRSTSCRVTERGVAGAVSRLHLLPHLLPPCLAARVRPCFLCAP